MAENWSVVTMQPALHVARPLLGMIVVSSLAFVLSVALFFFSQVYILRQITRPISALAQKADTMSKGELEDLSPEHVGRFGEMTSLEDSFNRMVQTVSARTSDLVATLQTLQTELQERKRAEQALRENQLRYRALFERTSDAVFIVDLEGAIIAANRQAADLLGHTDEALVGMSLERIIAPSEYPDSQEKMAELLLGQSQPIYERTLVRRDGSQVPVEINAALVSDPEGNPLHIQSIARDISARKRAEEAERDLEEKLERARRIESLGTLAGGVAHDLNNILGPMVAYPDLVLLDLGPQAPARSDLLRIKQAAQKAAAIVQDLLTLARRGVYQMSPLSLNRVIQEYVRSPSFVELQVRHTNVTFDIDLDPELLNVAGSGPHLSKAIMNLVTNGVEAMPEGGRLRISTACESLDYPIAAYEMIPAGDYVVVRIADTGTGIEAQDVDRIFEPFYTKKEMGRSGSGLGLAVVHGVVHDHKGRIDMKTEVGIGTEFALYFPVDRTLPVEVDENKIAYGGSERVLVIDDLLDQRDLAIRLLASLGYAVHAVENGRAAIRYLQEHQVDMIVLDMLLEDGFDGLDTWREIVKINPRQKSVIASGFSASERVREAQRLGAGPFIRKPYTLVTIARTIREALDAP
jgi:PAS domain S-box-containing protein